MIFKILIGWFAFVFILVYMVSLLKLYSVLKKEWKDVWLCCGAPSITDPNGQIKIFSLLVLGKGLSDDFRVKNRAAILTVRFSFFFGFLSFIFIFLMIFFGAYD